MNEMSPPGITLPGPEGSGSSPLSCAAPPPIKVSYPFDQIIAALARAMLNIVPPVKNKHVTVDSRRTGRSYSYDYATLDVVLEAVTKHLAQEGLILTQMPRERRELDIVLMHASGQWMMATIPLMSNTDGFQDFSGAVTAARRVGIQALLSISAEDDDDGNANAGNDVGDRHWDPEIEQEQAGLHPLVLLARNATSVSQGCNLLDAWPARALEMGKLRRADPEQWENIVAEVAKGLQNTLGTAIAAAWRGVLLAETPEHHAAIRAKWDGDWAPVLDKFRAVQPGAFAALMRHVNERRTEIEADARRDAGETAADDLPTGSSIRAAAIEAQRAAGDGFRRLIIDALGDPATDEFTDPEAWAKAFTAIRDKTPPEEHDALDSFNMDAIAEASQMIGADIILREAFETKVSGMPDGERAPDADDVPEEPPVPREIVAVEFPYNRIGGVDIALYLEALGAVIDTLAGPEDIARFEELNRPRYTAASLSLVVQIRVLKKLAGRKQALGIPLPTKD